METVIVESIVEIIPTDPLRFVKETLYPPNRNR